MKGVLGMDNVRYEINVSHWKATRVSGNDCPLEIYLTFPRLRLQIADFIYAYVVNNFEQVLAFNQWIIVKKLWIHCKGLFLYFV